MKHVLIIGGTGMLRGTSKYCIEQGNIVTILARNQWRLDSLRSEYPYKKGRIWTISQDYRDSKQALAQVKEAADMYVHIDLAVLWIHNTGRRFSEQVKKFLLSHHPKTKVYQLWGSSTVNPLEMSRTKWRKSYPERYREIFLGYRQDGSSSRWLTNREISEGTIRAIEEDAPEYVIGKIEPWTQNP